MHCRSNTLFALRTMLEVQRFCGAGRMRSLFCEYPPVRTTVRHSPIVTAVHETLKGSLTIAMWAGDFLSHMKLPSPASLPGDTVPAAMVTIFESQSTSASKWCTWPFLLPCLGCLVVVVGMRLECGSLPFSNAAFRSCTRMCTSALRCMYSCLSARMRRRAGSSLAAR